jgi:hypothetical protein
MDSCDRRDIWSAQCTTHTRRACRAHPGAHVVSVLRSTTMARLELLLLLAGAAAVAASSDGRLVERPIAFAGSLGAALERAVPIVDPPRRIAGYFKCGVIGP